MPATLMINDLAPSEALDREAMTAICGGFGTLGFVPRNLINQELNATTIVGTDSIFAGGNTQLNVNTAAVNGGSVAEDNRGEFNGVDLATVTQGATGFAPGGVDPNFEALVDAAIDARFHNLIDEIMANV